MMKRNVLLAVVLFLILTESFGQSEVSYDFAFSEINKMLNGQSKLDFKRAVFLTEDAFYSNELSYNDFCERIDSIEIQLNQFMEDKGVIGHPMGKQFAIFSYMMEPSKYNANKKMTYDFEDLMGNKDWAKTFVTKLLNTKTGNCHSLPFLYKILAEEITAEAYLSLGPNHLYVKHKDDKGLWVNVELTNGTFPRDGWIISSLSITTDAIKREVYMEPLSLKESVALTLVDLALGFQFLFGNNDFILQCCDTVTKYFPECINAYMIKREVLSLKRIDLLQQNKNQTNDQISNIETLILSLNNKIESMGYKEAPKEQYEQWVKEAEKQREKQQLGKVKTSDSSKN